MKRIVVFIASVLISSSAAANTVGSPPQQCFNSDWLANQIKTRDKVLEAINSQSGVKLTFIKNGYDPFDKPSWYYKDGRIVLQTSLQTGEAKQVLTELKHALAAGSDKTPAGGVDNWCNPQYVLEIKSQAGEYDLLACSRASALIVYEHGEYVSVLKLGANITYQLQDIVKKKLGKKPLPSLPPQIGAIREEIRHKNPDEFRTIIVKHLGEPTKDVGSGVRIEEWNVQGGYLFLHETDGPYFYSDHNKRIWLVDTITLVGDALFGQYEMLSTPLKNGMNDWLGELQLYKNLSYKFIDSKQFHVPRAKPYDIFFLKYPKGRMQIKYASRVSAKTLLEDIEKGSTIAVLTFISDDEMHEAKFDIVTNPENKELMFNGKALPFKMHKDW